MQILRSASKLEVLFNQDGDVVISKELQFIYVGLFLSGFWNQKDVRELESDKVKLRSASNAGSLDKLKLNIKQVKTLKEFINLMIDGQLKVVQIIKRITNEY